MEPISPFGKPSSSTPDSTPSVGRDSLGHEYRNLSSCSLDGTDSAVSGVFIASRSVSPEGQLLRDLGCPVEEIDKLVGHGYIEEYYRHIASGLPQPAAEALLCAKIGQNPMISEALRGEIGSRLAPGGTSGVYFLKNFKGETTFVFKPEDEEPFMPGCPHSFEDKFPASTEYPVRLSIKGGASARNEVLAGKIMSEVFGLDVPDRKSVV